MQTIYTYDIYRLYDKDIFLFCGELGTWNSNDENGRANILIPYSIYKHTCNTNIILYIVMYTHVYAFVSKIFSKHII